MLRIWAAVLLSAFDGAFAAGPTAVPDGDGGPLAGHSDKSFFLRDPHSWFVAIPKGRINVDAYAFPGDSATIFLRRARLGLAGTIAGHVDFRVEGDFAGLAGPTDASVVLNYLPYLRLEAGQFFAPFTLENMTSENFTDFMERSMTVRFAVPAVREIGGMVFGELPLKVARYYAGVFGGDGPNVRSLDGRPALIGRTTVEPLSFLGARVPWLEDLWIGGSFWWKHAHDEGAASAPSQGATTGDLGAVTTQGALSVFTASYANGTDAAMNPIRSHLAPDGTTLKYALELNLPLGRRFGLRGEYTRVSIDVRRYDDTSERTDAGNGHFGGWAAYGEAYAWIGGDLNVERPGVYQWPHWSGYRPAPPPRWSLMLAAKYEHVAIDVDLPASPAPKSGNDPAAGHYGVDAAEAGANLWLTRHARLSVNYATNFLGLGAGAAANAKTNPYFHRFDHELLFRVAAFL